MPIPVNIITGTLGVGKTTAIRALLSQKPPGEHWAILVNEFGALGIDGAVIDSATPSSGDKGYTIREVAGGCMCCANGTPLAVTIAQLARRAKPQRLLVEPSGLGHPAGLVDIFQSEHLKTAFQLQATICLVDPHMVKAEDPVCATEGFINQVNISDVLVANKADLAAPGDLEAFHLWAQELFPPKVRLCTTSQGELDVGLLEVPCEAARLLLPQKLQRGLLLGDSHDHADAPPPPLPPPPEDDSAEAAQPAEPAARGEPVRVQAEVAGQKAAGWRFSAEDIFDRNRLQAFLTELAAHHGVARCKGVFRIGKEWVVPSWSLGDDGDRKLSLATIAYRRDSRVEIIAAIAPSQTEPAADPASGNAAPSEVSEAAAAAAAAANANWDSVEVELLRCLKG
ncbi:hypothetical protein CYMTET_13959 [Cymbomonas tetramitiformis]|uniref:CobW/HypB/UreG nucleotide-binding domain-containing protein n=1 Tax=Cymbomonas tetramitiformis TaxID=36881 RepID=A0AAE0GHK9_9CHLO|nr:hypothetical protein CYMTET_13959 [Cymbomonas tetramitiformis]